ncbi:MAG: hypothetical protein ACRDYB_02145 [Acidimicrobiales bacterium]
MSEEPGTLRIHLPKPLLVVAALAAGVVLGMLVLLASARPAGAAVLSGPPTVTQAGATTTVGDGPAGMVQAPAGVAPALPPASIPPSISSIASSATSGILQAGGSAAHSLAGGTVTPGLVPPLTPPALPVLSAPPVSPVLGAVVNQGPQTTPIVPSQPLSATALGVVLRTGSAEFALGIPTSGDLAGAPIGPAVPPLSPPTPSLPNPLATTGASSGSGVHGSTLDSLPPTILVLALIVVVGLELERRRRPKTRFDLRFCPPG